MKNFEAYKNFWSLQRMFAPWKVLVPSKNERAESFEDFEKWKGLKMALSLVTDGNEFKIVKKM